MRKRERKGPSITEKLESARANRYKVIHERNLLILALVKHAGFEAHLVPSGTDAPGKWDKVICLHTPAGQLHWKLSPKDAEDFEDILKFTKKSDWDGARQADKVARLEKLHTLSCQNEDWIKELTTRLEVREGTIAMAVARLGGMVEGAPTARVNFLQRIDELVRIEAAYVKARRSSSGEGDEGTRCPESPTFGTRRVETAARVPASGNAGRTAVEGRKGPGVSNFLLIDASDPPRQSR
jgi:hypothetical protein